MANKKHREKGRNVTVSMSAYDVMAKAAEKEGMNLREHVNKLNNLPTHV